MRPGFTLIEVLLALVIVAIMGSMLFTSLIQIQFGARVADDLIDESQRALIIHQQLEKDFMGVMVPVAAVFEEEEKNAKKPAPQAPQQNQPAKQPEKVPEPVEKKEKPKPVTKVFFASNRENNIDTLTFITNNPLQVFWSEKTGKAKPRVARVVYRLVPEKDAKNVFKLVRQEGSDLQFDAYKPGSTKEIREFMLADNIKSLSITYHYVVEPKKDDKGTNKEKEKEKKEVKTTKEWNSDEKEQKEKRGGKQYPDWITITCALWDIKRERSTDYEFKIQHIALGLPPTAKVEELPAQNKPAGGPQGAPGQQPPVQPSNLDILAQQIDAMLSGARSQMLTATGNNQNHFGMPQ